MLSRPSDPKSIDWTALERVRQKAEAAGASLDRAAWQALFREALVATGGQRGPALDQLSLYGQPDWVPAS